MNTALENLDLSDTDLKTESLIALSTVLRNNTTLRFLHINRPLLFTHQEEPTVHFAKMLKVYEFLYLDRHRLYTYATDLKLAITLQYPFQIFFLRPRSELQ